MAVAHELVEVTASAPKGELQGTSPSDGEKPGTLRHSVRAGFEELRHLQSAWDGLVANVSGDVYGTYDWCAVWWRHYGYGRRLHIHLFHDGDELVGAVPLFTERLPLGPMSIRAVRLVGCDHSVTTCTPIVRPDRLGDVVRSLIAYMDRHMGWDLIHLGPLPCYYAHRSGLAEAAKACPAVGRTVEVTDAGPHGVFELPRTYAGYLSGLSRNERQNIHKRERRLEKAHRLDAVVVGPDDLDAAFEEFVGQHQAQWRAVGQLGHFADWPGAEAYHREMAARQARHGRLMLLRLSVDGECIGYQYNYHFAERVHAILASRTLDPQWECHSPGRLVHCAVVRAAIERGAGRMDALRGEYEYKRRLGGALGCLQAVSMIHRGLACRLRVGQARANARLLDLLYRRIWVNRLAPRLSSPRRPLRDVWIRSRIG
ncbi:MAG: GNAT family N-acetyltransferase [Phycisphaerae bacterium]|nr:GNAT family N-acetyltransferase [Phycisphaerae bacterium]